jgi:hypothetical protein
VLFALVALTLTAGADARQGIRPIVLHAGDSASYTGMRAACAAMSTGHGRTLLGFLCYEPAPQGSTLGPFENDSYQVVMRLDGLAQMVRVDAHGFPDRPVFSYPPRTPLGAYDLGQGTKNTIRTLDVGFVLGPTSLRCRGTVLGVAAPSERGIACAFATPAGMPRPNSWGIAISDLAAYVVHFDAAGHAASGFSRRQPRR